MSRQPDISVVWLGEHNTCAGSVQGRVWTAICARDDWAAWLDEHVDPDLLVVVEFSERDRERLTLRGDTLSYLVPDAYVRAAYEARTLPDFMAELFHDLYAAYAQRRRLPAPPGVRGTTVPSRLP
ncbi:hypothetical protein ACFP3Q_11370 [Nocardioides sp. GCM10027113]|uniref:hypothetical protein n=1 Tax=unclassified Nocardioides TaxID=2615069 RepID=UPI00361C8D48